jgi:hypothetical protein
MRVSEERVLRKSFAAEGRVKEEAKENCTVSSFVIVIILRVLLGYEEVEMGGVGSTHLKENECILGFDRNI